MRLTSAPEGRPEIYPSLTGSSVSPRGALHVRERGAAAASTAGVSPETEWETFLQVTTGELTTKWLRRGTHHSVKELVASIRTWITNWNDDPKPFVWHKTADEILDSLAPDCQRISDSKHQPRSVVRVTLLAARDVSGRPR